MREFKNISLTVFKFQFILRPTLSLARGTNRQFYCTGVIIYNKLDNYFVVSADRQTFLGFEMSANLHDTSPLNVKPFRGKSSSKNVSLLRKRLTHRINTDTGSLSWSHAATCN